MTWREAFYRPQHTCQMMSLMMSYHNVMVCEHDVTTNCNVATLHQDDMRPNVAHQ